MHNSVAAHLSAWESFYIIVASSAGALTGLQFVVIALVAEAGRKSSMHEVSAFGTPNVMHFCAVLLLGAMLSAPWRALSSVAVAVGALGLSGLVYIGIVIKRARRQRGYKPVLGDWVWHTILPFLAYAGLFAAGIAIPRGPASALFVIGASALLLLFIGIHNSWDTVTYLAVGQWESAGRSEGPTRPPP